MTQYIHDFDCLASITNENEDFDAIPPEQLRTAMLIRVLSLQTDEIREAFGQVRSAPESPAPNNAIEGDPEHICAVKIREMLEDPRKAAMTVIKLEALERLTRQVYAHLADKPGCWSRKDLLALISTNFL